MAENKDMEFEEIECEAVELEFEDGTKQEFVIVCEFEIEDIGYAALQDRAEFEDEDNEESELLMMHCSRGENDSIEIQNIEDEEELQEAIAVFEAIMEADEDDFEEIEE